MQRRLAYIVAACRTPIGTYNGGLAQFTAPELGAFASKALFDRCNVPKESVDEVYFGNVCQAGIGQNPARQVCIKSGLADSVTCTTVNKVCASGLKAVSFGSQSIELGLSNVVVAGGCESMSNVPYYNRQTRFGARMGNVDMIDGLLYDGLSDPFTHESMGLHAEKCAKEHFISRTKQDDFAVESFERAQMAYQRSMFEFEIVPIEVPSKKGSPTVISQDEGCWKLNEDKLRNLRPAFDVNGTVTAGNSSQISDGGSALLLCSEEIVKELNLKPLVKILSYADAEQESSLFPTTPSLAIPKALSRAGLTMNDLTEDDFFEINEAFAVVGIANRDLLKINQFNINMYGGAVALGHPIGCSGARILTTLITALKENSGRYGIAGICNGGGGATALVVENLV